MHGIARISFTGGALLMPARNGYDRELVFDEAECCARRHGEARLELGARAILIRAAVDAPSPCSRCGKPVDRLAFAFGARSLCRRCARQTAR
ncbi:MAG: hypothetical protein SF182_08750 [Deltaproteobacteria bacterium]|nr:hypothetical protein [Deltaproteobacteria bacterium]